MQGNQTKGKGCVMDLISRGAAAEAIYRALKLPVPDYRRDPFHDTMGLAYAMANEIQSAQPDSCKGCKHMGLWENEVENGYPSPCTRCKRRASDNYER